MSSEEMGPFGYAPYGSARCYPEELKRANETISSNTLEQQCLNALVHSFTEQLHESRQSIANKERIIEELKSSVRASKKQRLGRL